VREGLVVKSDGVAIHARNAERACDLQRRVRLRQLPQAAEQSLGLTPGEHQLSTTLDPQLRAGEHGKLALFLARGDDRQLVLASRARGLAVRCERAQQAARLCRRAQGRAELHEALVELAWRMRVG
jgi:hypothetical protein